MNPIKLFLLFFVVSSAATEAPLLWAHAPSAKDAFREHPSATRLPAPMPAPAESRHYAVHTPSEVAHG